MGQRVACGAVLLAVAVLAAASARAGERAWWQAPPVEGSLYLDLQRRSEPEIFGLEAGISGQYTDFISSRLGVALLDARFDHHVFGGVTASVRYGPPWRVAPFAGIGGFVGTWADEVRADDDGVDNDHDGVVDEHGEQKAERIDAILIVYPEVGLHLWLFDGVRLTLSGRYHVTSARREHDGWLASVGLSVFLPE